MVDNQSVPVPEQPESQAVPPAVEPMTPAEQPAMVEQPVIAEPVLEAVVPPAVETPVVADPPVVPSVEEKKGEIVNNEPQRPKKSRAQFFIGFVSNLLGLVAIAYVFVLWSLVEGNFTDPQFAQFLDMLGMQPTELKDKFTLLTHILFGGVSFIFLIMALVKFFQWVMSPADSFYKKTHIKKVGVYTLILFFFVGIWVGLIWLISGAEANPPVATGKTEQLILTKPLNAVGLTAPVTVDFDLGVKLVDEGKIPAEYLKEVLWDFDNDGNYDDASGLKVSHRFLDRGTNNGRFPIHVKVIYFSPSVNAEKEYRETIDVIVANVAAEAKMKAVPEAGAIPLSVKFSASDSVDADGDIVLYEWDMDGDGEYELRGADLVETEKTFYQIGDHIVRLRITGANNDFAIEEKTISVVAAEEKIRAEITSPDSDFEGMIPLSVTFEGNQSYTRMGKIVKYEWRIIGEDKPFEGRKMQRVFDTPGEYEVELIVINEAGDKDNVSQMVTVYERRDMKILTSPKLEEEEIVLNGKVPFEVTFDASASEIPKAVEWRWDFEADGIIDEYAKKTSYTFRKAGVYDVKLMIVDADDNEFVAIQKVNVENIGVRSKISANPSSGSVPLTVVFDGSGSQSTDGEIIDYIWEFPGEAPLHYSGKLTREFKEVGVFPVKMTALTSTGVKNVSEILISVRGQELQAEFTATPLVGNVPLDVKFSPAGSTGNINSYYWEFGDGAISTDAFPTHKFTYPGEFPVKLKITDSRGIVSDITKNVTVKPNPESE